MHVNIRKVFNKLLQKLRFEILKTHCYFLLPNSGDDYRLKEKYTVEKINSHQSSTQQPGIYIEMKAERLLLKSGNSLGKYYWERHLTAKKAVHLQPNEHFNS